MADEPTGKLDPDTSRAVLDFLEEINREGKTIVMVTHDHRTARSAKRTLKLVGGEISYGDDGQGTFLTDEGMGLASL